MTAYQIDDVITIVINEGFKALTLDEVNMRNHSFKIIQPLDNDQVVAISRMGTSMNDPLLVDVAYTQDGMHDIPYDMRFIVLEPLEGSVVIPSKDDPTGQDKDRLCEYLNCKVEIKFA